MNRHTGASFWRRPDLPVAMGGLLGLVGVLVAAAGAHRGGGDLATTAAEFAFVHGVALIALGAVMQGFPGAPRILGAAAWGLFAGTVMFSGDLAASALLQWRPFPPAAPIGGTLLIVGWLLVTVAGLRLGRLDPES